MKKIPSITLAVALAIPSALSQSPPPPAAIGFVNAVGATTRTDFQIDGKSLKRAGFVEGGYTSSFMVSEGTHQLTFTNGESEKATQAVQAQAGTIPLYILYKVAVPRPNAVAKNFLKLTSVPAQGPARAPRFFVLSTLEGRAAVIRLNGSDVRVDPLRLGTLQGNALTVETPGAKPIHYDPKEPGNYVLVLFEGSNLPLRAVLVPMSN